MPRRRVMGAQRRFLRAVGGGGQQSGQSAGLRAFERRRVGPDSDDTMRRIEDMPRDSRQDAANIGRVRGDHERDERDRIEQEQRDQRSHPAQPRGVLMARPRDSRRAPRSGRCDPTRDVHRKGRRDQRLAHVRWRDCAWGAPRRPPGKRSTISRRFSTPAARDATTSLRAAGSSTNLEQTLRGVLRQRRVRRARVQSAASAASAAMTVPQEGRRTPPAGPTEHPP